MADHYHQGFFKPKNPQKYVGNVDNIVYRSSWEKAAMNYFDQNSAFLRWASEEVIIPYVCPTDNKVHRYFVDFIVQVETTSGEKKTYLVEIKPEAQTRAPKYPGKTTQRFLTETLTFAKNQAKWAAAEAFCKQRGWEFIKLTEYDLGIKKRKDGTGRS